MKKIIFIFLSLIFMSGCSTKDLTDASTVNVIADSQQEAVSFEKGIVYNNTTYGFTFELPESWKGYSIVTDRWEGRAITDSGQAVVETGPQLSIRHPLWSSKQKRQDIPIMIFTSKQWKDLQDEKFTVSAAPIGPRLLGRNDKYFFALPPRYNFTFLKGYEEVGDILNSNPLNTLKS